MLLLWSCSTGVRLEGSSPAPRAWRSTERERDSVETADESIGVWEEREGWGRGRARAGSVRSASSGCWSLGASPYGSFWSAVSLELTSWHPGRILPAFPSGAVLPPGLWPSIPPPQVSELQRGPSAAGWEAGTEVPAPSVLESSRAPSSCSLEHGLSSFLAWLVPDILNQDLPRSEQRQGKASIAPM